MRPRLATLAVAAALAAACGGKKPPSLLPEGPPVERMTLLAIDSTWTRAMREFRSGKWKSASEQFEKAMRQLPASDPRAQRAHFFIGECRMGEGDYLQAAREFRRVADESPDFTLAADALQRTGDAYRELWRRPELDPTYGQTALATYQEVATRFPGSAAASRAQGAIRELEDWFAYKQYKAGRFYLRLRAYDSAIIYFKDIVATYPRSAVAPEALVHLAEIYRTLEYVEDLKETCGYMRRFHAGAKGVEKACRDVAPVAGP